MCLKKYLLLLFFLLLLQFQYAQVPQISSFEIVGAKKIKKDYLEKVLFSKAGIPLDAILVKRSKMQLLESIMVLKFMTDKIMPTVVWFLG
jgi:hypothetical protein